MQDNSINRESKSFDFLVPYGTTTREYINELLKEGKDMDLRDQYGRAPLHYAIYTRDVEVVRLLLEQGCKTSIQDCDGFTALHYAAINADINGLTIIQLLIEAKANPFRTSRHGKTASDLSNNPVIKKLLTDYEENSINADSLFSFEYSYGLTSLH